MTLRPLLLALLAALALLGSGCGVGDAEPPTLAEYEASVVLTRDRVDFALSRITRGKSQEELLDRMEEASAAIDQAASDLEESGAPEDFEGDTEKLTKALHQLSVDLSATAHDIQQPEFGGVFNGLQGLNFESWDQANLALAALIGLGIDVKLIGRH